LRTDEEEAANVEEYNPNKGSLSSR